MTLGSAHEPCVLADALTHATVKKKNQPTVLAPHEINTPLFTNKRKAGFFFTTISRHRVDVASLVSRLNVRQVWLQAGAESLIRDLR